MEALVVIVGLFVLIAFPIAVLCHLASLHGSLERTNQLLSRVSSDLAEVRRDSWHAEKKPHAESAESKSHAESAETAESSSMPPSERGVARSAGGSTPSGAVHGQSVAMPRTEYSPSLASLGSPLSEGAESKAPPPLPPAPEKNAHTPLLTIRNEVESIQHSAFGIQHSRPPAAADEPPPEPTKLEQWTAAAWDWLRVGEAWRPGWIPGEYAVAAVQLLRAAALLLLFGAAWFVRYVHEQGWFSPAGRVAAGFAAAAALVAGGAALLRRRYRPVGLALAGVGFALAEFVDWAGANLYGVLPAPAAFGIAAALALAAGAMAWRASSLLLALVALFAGYSAPAFFPEAVRGGGDGPLLAWLLVLAAEAAALATARGWRSLPWLSLAISFAHAAPLFVPRADGLGRGAALAFLGAHALLAWAQCFGHALLRRRAPFWFDAVAWLAATAATALLATPVAAAPWPVWAHGLPCLALAAGCAALAAAFWRRGVRGEGLRELFVGTGVALALAFLCLSFEGSARCVALAAAAAALAWASARFGSVAAGLLAPAAWLLWTVHVGEPDGAAERVLRIGSGVLSLWAGGLLVLRTRPRGEHPFAPILLWGAWVASLVWGSWEARHAFPGAAPALALWWSALALVTLVAGLRHARRDVRGAALCLFALAAAKFLLFDQAGAPTPERVAGFLGVGLLLLLGSAVYIRSSARPTNH